MSSILDNMKILFIKPHSPTINQAIDLPLGILSLSAYLKTMHKDKVDIRFIDFRVQEDPWILLERELKEFNPDIVGVSMLTFEEGFLKKCANICKANCSAKIVVGGPHATICYEGVLQDRKVDYVVVGEGERVLSNVVDRSINGEDISSLKGLAYRDAEGIVNYNGRDEIIANLDDLPYLDYDLAHIERYRGYHAQMNFLLADLKYIPIMSSRACPYDCAYCHNIFGKQLRKRSVEHFLGEVKKLYYEYGVREFHIVDDIFNIDRQRMHRILRGIIADGMKIRIAFPNALRGDLLNYDDISLLKDAGVYMVTLAIESGSPRLQKIIHKNLNIDKVMENIHIASELGILTKAYFMLGFPGETVEEINQTIDLALSSPLDMAAFFAVTPFYGTELYRMAEKEWPDIDIGNYGSYYEKSLYELATGYNLKRLQKKAYMKFYSSSRLFRLFRKTPLKYYLVRRFISAVVNTLRI
jgi:anaerobic magnesium-protoporphyrin IX monomethyl ester cyclase